MSIKLKSSAGTRNVPEMTDIYQSIAYPTKLNTQDLDELKTPGVYYWSGDGVSNTPSGVSSYGVTIVLQAAGTVFK